MAPDHTPHPCSNDPQHPEGLAVGVAFGALAIGSTETLAPAVALTVGIGILNFPEGMAISMPLRREGFSTRRSFWYG